MITRHIIQPHAGEDLDQQLDYYEQKSGLELALRFLSAVEEGIELLRRNPAAGSLRSFENPRLRGLRSWPVPGFEDIRISYLQPDEITLSIVRILHGKRDLRAIFRKED